MRQHGDDNGVARAPALDAHGAHVLQGDQVPSHSAGAHPSSRRQGLDALAVLVPDSPCLAADRHVREECARLDARVQERVRHLDEAVGVDPAGRRVDGLHVEVLVFPCFDRPPERVARSRGHFYATWTIDATSGLIGIRVFLRPEPQL